MFHGWPPFARHCFSAIPWPLRASLYSIRARVFVGFSALHHEYPLDWRPCSVLGWSCFFQMPTIAALRTNIRPVPPVPHTLLGNPSLLIDYLRHRGELEAAMTKLPVLVACVVSAI